ncbi:type I DNA topoisomerase [candidate division NPL-UPA2 bacterium Unc8]|uniref:DNA topoisomerase 1 n=1 Tax=candidate division NPL-UPA2 bacterium Unc8 TaxID=1980939 RepID=A0A399FW30_UNCN2|nr:DNA topoisomerase 1 [Bacillota bacterium]RII00414.1 MAG: type I DNA topoisomerase [candidate division NPL-UPA2 bacterium Unc8]
MPKLLVIVESSAKARTIDKFLGSSYSVKSCLGHIRDLPRDRFGIDPEDGFRPHYIIIPQRKEVIKEIKKNSQSAEKVFLASDPDREGEAISWHLSEVLGGDNLYRVTFNEITKEEVEKAIKNPREIDLNKVKAQQARRILDRIVGYKLSPFLWKKIGKGLSAGRVQSVTLRIVCDREKEIADFVSREYWTIAAKLKKKVGEEGDFEAKLEKISGKKAEIDNESEAKRVIYELRKEEFFVESIEKKEQKKNPPPPFTTSQFQQEAARKLRFTPTKAMRIAQELYEGIEIGKERVGLITYMRTDSVRLSSQSQKEASTYIKEKFGRDFAPSKSPVYRSRKGAQEAHEAIRPTSIRREPEKMKEFLSPEQYRLYHMIWLRFLASQMKPALFKLTTIKIKAGKFNLQAKGVNIKFLGFTIIYGDKEEESNIPDLQMSEKLDVIALQEKQHFTKPLPRFSDATLVKVLEEEGIGRPSTYAPIIQTIEQREYVEKVDGKFYPTELGVMVINLLVARFPKIMDLKFTSHIENELDRIEDGKSDWMKLLSDFYHPFIAMLDKANDKVKKMEIATDRTCPECDGNLTIKIGKYGKFFACKNYPQCKYTAPIGLGIKCPEDKCDGEIVEKRTRKKKIFFGCNRYPECNFSTWDKPIAKECPSCGARFLVVKKRRGGYLQCINEKCNYTSTE